MMNYGDRLVGQKAAIDQLLRQLESGVDLADIANQLASEAQRELLRRCAVVRAFDSTLFDEVLCRVPTELPEPVSFEFLNRHSSVEAVPRAKETYRLLPNERAKLLAQWRTKSEAADLVHLRQRLVKYYQEHDEPLKLLYQRSSVEPDGALKQFEEMYDKADQEFDLARCGDLIALFSDGRSLSDKLAQSRDERLARLNARSLWADEFYRTGSYLQRPLLIDDLEMLFGSANPACWVYQIHAAGGMGKTMFLRWAIARWCVPRGIPCARIDFDDANPLLLAEEPKELALEISRQWNKQLAGTPLDELIERLSGESGLASNPLGELPKYLPKNKPALIVLDTLEEVLIPHPDALLKMLQHLRHLHEGSFAQTRLILSGRYDLQVRLGSKEPQWLGAASLPRKISGFDEAEGRDFLTRLRGLPDDDRVQAAVERSNGNPRKQAAGSKSDVKDNAATEPYDGNPLKLWLYSVLLKESSELTAAEIRADSGVDVEYLIRRIVLRIGENDRDPKTGKVRDEHMQLRWVLRYGVVPSRVTLEFLQTDLMRKRLQRETSGMGAQDDSKRGLSEKLAAEDVFTRSSRWYRFRTRVPACSISGPS